MEDKEDHAIITDDFKYTDNEVAQKFEGQGGEFGGGGATETFETEPEASSESINESISESDGCSGCDNCSCGSDES